MREAIVKMTFDVNVAKDVGTDAAIILSNIQYWVFKNAANETNYHDGKYWTYNSVSAWTDLFEWLSTKQVRTCLNKLIEGGYIVDGEYNDDKRNRTKWYTPVGKYCKLPKGKDDLPISASSSADMGSSYKEHIVNTDNKLFIKKSVSEIEINSPEVVEPNAAISVEDSIPVFASAWMLRYSPSLFESAWMKAPKYVRAQKERVIDHFNAAVLKEGIEYDGKKLFGRLLGMINNWKQGDTEAVAVQTTRNLMK